MYGKWQLARKYLSYLLHASNGRGHGIHSPFMFEFVTRVLNDSRHFYCYETIESIRAQLKEDSRLLSIADFGAGSRLHLPVQRKVSAIAKSSLKPKKYSRLLFRMVDFYGPATILELGTSLGITTAYLASGNANAAVITMEGAPAVAAIAQQTFEAMHLKNVQLVQGNFDDTLPATLAQLQSVDFAFVDGNHRYAPTMDYFRQLLPKTNPSSILIFDDIHWSEEMERAWKEITTHPAVTLSIDLFFIGIVFFREENKEKEHFVIRF